MALTSSMSFLARVKASAACIIANDHSRKADSYGEMGDDNAVTVAIYRMSLEDPILAEAIRSQWSGVPNPSNPWPEVIEKYKNVPTEILPELARRMRASSKKEFEASKAFWNTEIEQPCLLPT